MSTLIDDLLLAELPDKVTIKYKPSRMRKLLKQFAELITAQGRIIRIDQKVATLVPPIPITVSHVTGMKSVLERIVFKEFGQQTPYAPTDTLKISIGPDTLYDGALLPEIVIEGNPAIVFEQADLIEIHAESSTASEHLFAVAIIMEEVS